ncbi:MAG: DUF87 domain-containing protein [Candidatus Bathyarchaeota archaeon]|nr:DUF87 domain-containing protein [Candidatus Bathyarchaeota archaeon]
METTPTTHIKEHYGIITNNTNTNQFNFLISPPKNRQPPQKHNLILTDHPTDPENTKILAEIQEITTYEETATTTIKDRIGKHLATAKIIGTINTTNPNQPLQPLLTPPNPGSRIYMPYNTTIENIFKHNPQGKPYTNPIIIGKTTTTAPTPENTNQPINIHLDANHLTTTHTLITATDGHGKTQTTKNLTKQLQTTTPIVILDPNNEYPHTQTTQPTNNPETITKKIKPNQTLTITTENLTQTQKTDHYTKTLQTLTTARKQKTTPPHLLIIEEADTIPQNEIQEILSQKIGIATILITNHPSQLGAKTLNQTQTQLIGKTTNPKDIETLTNMTTPNTQQLNTLTTAEWILTGTNIIYPTKIKTFQP